MQLLIYILLLLIQIDCLGKVFQINKTSTLFEFPNEIGTYDFTGWTNPSGLSTTTCNSLRMVGYLFILNSNNII